MDVSIVRRSRQDVVYDEAPDVRRIGLLALSTDLTTERDYARIIPGDRAAVYTARVAFETRRRRKTCGKWRRASATVRH